MNADANDAGDPSSPINPLPANGTVDPTYPAPHGPMPLVDYNGGTILTSPRIVTITIAGDPMREDLETFGDAATKSNWWKQVSAGYCVAPAGTPCIGLGASGGNVVLPALAHASYKDSVDPKAPSAIKDLLRTNIVNGSMPAPTSNSIYVLYMPESVSVTLETYRSCVDGGFYGYHSAMTLGSNGTSGPKIYYAVVARCSGSEPQATRTASHEIIEAATDPDVGGTLGYYMNDPLWSFDGGEVGDVCVDYTGNDDDTIEEAGFTYQRSWSNVSAAAGSDPCVPAPSDRAYFNVSPRAGSEKIALAVGESRTIELDAFSDGPTPNWNIDVIDVAALSGELAYLRAKYDIGTVNNGTKVSLTLTLLQSIDEGSGVPYVIVSHGHGALHTWMAEVTQRR